MRREEPLRRCGAPVLEKGRSSVGGATRALTGQFVPIRTERRLPRHEVAGHVHHRRAHGGSRSLSRFSRGGRQHRNELAAVSQRLTGAKPAPLRNHHSLGGPHILRTWTCALEPGAKKPPPPHAPLPRDRPTPFSSHASRHVSGHGFSPAMRTNSTPMLSLRTLKAAAPPLDEGFMLSERE